MKVTRDIMNVARKIERQVDLIQSESDTKNVCVEPFMGALGYCSTDLTQVRSEYVSDIGARKGEKVDYALIVDGNLSVLIEVKSATTTLSRNHAIQLLRYYNATPAKIGILTNGIQYHFYADLVQQGTMDDSPYLIVDILTDDEESLSKLEQYHRDVFDENQILMSARDNADKNAVLDSIINQFSSPPADLVKLVGRDLHNGRFTEAVVERYRNLITAAFNEHVNNLVRERIECAINSTTTQKRNPVVEGSESITNVVVDDIVVEVEGKINGTSVTGTYHSNPSGKPFVKVATGQFSPTRAFKEAIVHAREGTGQVTNSVGSGWDGWKYFCEDTGEMRSIKHLRQ